MTDNPFLAPDVEVRTRDGREAKVLGFNNGIIAAAVRDTVGRWALKHYSDDGSVCTDRTDLMDLIIVPPVHPDLAGKRTWRCWLAPISEYTGLDCPETKTTPQVLITLTDGISPHECVKVVLPGDGL